MKDTFTLKEGDSFKLVTLGAYWFARCWLLYIGCGWLCWWLVGSVVSSGVGINFCPTWTK